jgi:hypothetical protein
MGRNIIIIMKNVIQIIEEIRKGKNIIFYNKNIYDCYNQLQDDYICIYFNEPIPIKGKLIKIINEITEENRPSLNRKTIATLKEILIKGLKYKRLIICFNHFDRLTNKSVQVYQSLNSLENIQFVCSFNKKFKKEIYPFYSHFELANKEEYEEKTVKDEINMTFPVYLFIALLCFVIYIKAASSLYMAFILIGAAWFSLIIFRTLIFIGGRP